MSKVKGTNALTNEFLCIIFGKNTTYCFLDVEANNKMLRDKKESWMDCVYHHY